MDDEPPPLEAIPTVPVALMFIVAVSALTLIAPDSAFTTTSSVVDWTRTLAPPIDTAPPVDATLMFPAVLVMLESAAAVI